MILAETINGRPFSSFHGINKIDLLLTQNHCPSLSFSRSLTSVYHFRASKIATFGSWYFYDDIIFVFLVLFRPVALMFCRAKAAHVHLQPVYT